MSESPATPIWQEIQAPKWEPNRTAWLLTCVDLTSLLVGFFVLLFSTQTLKRDKWEAITGSFQAQFAAHDIVVPAVADGADNAVLRVTVAKSGLAYLDTLLHQRMATDADWNNLVADNDRGGRGEMTYAVPQALQLMPAANDAWVRLGGAVRGWKNPVGVRVTVRSADAGRAAQMAADMASRLATSGMTAAFAEVKLDEHVQTAQVQLVVRP